MDDSSSRYGVASLNRARYDDDDDDDDDSTINDNESTNVVPLHQQQKQKQQQQSAIIMTSKLHSDTSTLQSSTTTSQHQQPDVDDDDDDNEVSALTSSTTTPSSSFWLPHYHPESSRARNALPQTHRQSQVDQKLSDIALARLQREGVYLVGRNENLERLQSILAAATTTHRNPNHFPKRDKDNKSMITNNNNRPIAARRHLVCVGGKSGSGKTALVQQALMPVTNHHQDSSKMTSKSTTTKANQKSDYFYLHAKFDTLQREQPLAGLQSALVSLGHQIMEETQRNRDDNDNGSNSLVNSLVQGLGQELGLLIPIMPNLVDAVGVEHVQQQQQTTASSPSSSSSTFSLKQSADRLKFVTRRFCQIIAAHKPVVWINDDVQWADPSSLDLLASILSDNAISNLLMVACFRNDHHDVEALQAFRERVWLPVKQWVAEEQDEEQVQQQQQQPQIALTEMTVENLTVEHVEELLAHSLQTPSEQETEGQQGESSSSNNSKNDIHALAQLVQKRTDGNPFHISQFLASLVQQRLLRYDMFKMEWNWDVEQVRDRSTATVNVIELVQQRLLRKRTSHDSQDDDDENSDNNSSTMSLQPEVLFFAACLGATFSGSLLGIVLKGFAARQEYATLYETTFESLPKTINDTKENNDAAVSDMLWSWVQDGAIESVSEQTFAFVHDKVQEAALTMVSDKALSDRLRYTAGYILFRELPPNVRDQHAFLIADLMHNSTNENHPDLVPSDIEERLQMVHLNQTAGSNAIAKSAFRSALFFFSNAISLLRAAPDNDSSPLSVVSIHHDLAVDLYSSAAECAYAMGDFAALHKYGDVVMSQADIPILSKMRVAYVMMDANLAQAISHDKKSGTASIDATRVAFDVLAELGCPLPEVGWKMKWKSTWGLLRLKGLAKKKTITEIETTLHQTKDATNVAVMKTLDKLTTAAYIFLPDLMPLCIVTSANWTFRHGFTEYSSPALSWCGLMLSYFMGDFEAGNRFGKAALALTRKLNVREVVSRSDLVSYVYAIHFLTRYEKCVDPMLNGYQLGLSTGDVESGLWCINFYVHFKWLTGAKIDTLYNDTTTYLKIMKDFGQINHYEYLSFWCQLFENLVEGPETTKLIGRSADETVSVPRMEEKGELAMISGYRIVKVSVCCFFGDFAKAADVAVQHGPSIFKFQPGQPNLTEFLYMAGMSCYVTAGNTKQSKYNRFAETCRKMLKDWVRKGNPNTLHLESLLDAEYERYRGNMFVCVKHYETGILLAERKGLTQYQALGNERYAYYWKSQGNADEARHRYEESLRLYSELGALHKTEALRDSYAGKVPTTLVQETMAQQEGPRANRRCLF